MFTLQKRFIALTSGLVMAGLVLTACGGDADEDDAGAPGAAETLHVLSYALENNPTIFENFTEQTGIEVVVDQIDSSQYPAVLQTRVAGKADVDVINLRGGAEFNKYAEAGTFLPYSDAAVLDKISDAGRAAGVYQGETYGYSISEYLIGVTYNKKLFEQAGITSPPTSWEELLSAADKLKAEDIDPFVYSAAEGWTNQYWYHSAVAQSAAEDPSLIENLKTGTAKWTDNVRFTTQIERFADIKDKDLLLRGGQSLKYGDATTAFNTGKAAMWVMGNWNLSTLEPAGFDVGAFALPTNSAGSAAAPASALSDNVWTITSWTKKADAAKQLMAYLAQPEVAKQDGEVAKRASTVQGVTVEVSPYQGDWDALAADAVPFPTDLGPSVNNDGPTLLGEITAKDASASDVIEKFQALQDNDNKAGY